MASEEFERQKAENKKNWKHMTFQQKFQFYLDYYLLRTVIIAACAAAVIGLVYTVLAPHEESVMTAAVFDQSLSEVGRTTLSEQLEQTLQIENERYQTVSFMDSMLSDSTTDITKFDTMLYSGEIDVVILGRTQFEQMAGQGVFLNLEELPGIDTEAFSDDLIETAGLLEEDTDDIEFDGSGKGEVKPYGISLSDSKLWSDSLAYTSEDEPVIGIAANSKRTENAEQFLLMLMNSQ